MKTSSCPNSTRAGGSASRAAPRPFPLSGLAAVGLIAALFSGCVSFPKLEERQQQEAAATPEAPRIDPQVLAARQAAATESRLHAVISLINEIYVGQDRVIFTDEDIIPQLQDYYAGRDMVFLPVEVIKIDKFGRLVTAEGERGVVVQGRTLEAGPARAVVQLREQTMDGDRVSWTNTYVKNEKGDWAVADDNAPGA
jgi:hypothetical protein